MPLIRPEKEQHWDERLNSQGIRPLKIEWKHLTFNWDKRSALTKQLSLNGRPNGIIIEKRRAKYRVIIRPKIISFKSIRKWTGYSWLIIWWGSSSF